MIWTVYASATRVVPRTAAWAIHRAYPVARERTVAADIESMARKMAAMREMLLQRFLSRLLRGGARSRSGWPGTPAPGRETLARRIRAGVAGIFRMVWPHATIPCVCRHRL